MGHTTPRHQQWKKDNGRSEGCVIFRWKCGRGSGGRWLKMDLLNDHRSIERTLVDQLSALGTGADVTTVQEQYVRLKRKKQVPDI